MKKVFALLFCISILQLATALITFNVENIQNSTNATNISVVTDIDSYPVIVNKKFVDNACFRMASTDSFLAIEFTTINFSASDPSLQYNLIYQVLNPPRLLNSKTNDFAELSLESMLGKFNIYSPLEINFQFYGENSVSITHLGGRPKFDFSNTYTGDEGLKLIDIFSENNEMKDYYFC